MTRAQFEAAQRRYRRTYDRLYTASARANDAAESDRIDRALREANDEYAVAKATFEARRATAPNYGYREQRRAGE